MVSDELDQLRGLHRWGDLGVLSGKAGLRTGQD